MSKITKVSFCRNVALVTLRNVPYESKIIAEILTAISENGVNVDMISQTAPLGQTIALAFTISIDATAQLMPVISNLRATYPELNLELAAGMTKLNFFDQDMVVTPGVAAKVFSMLAEGGIPVSMITTSTVDISILIQEHDEDAALRLSQAAYGTEPEEVPFA